MQTFLPYPSLGLSAKVLDYRRLGKQRVETMQIYHALIGEKKGWRNHPAVKMWEGYEAALLEYGIVMCKEWRHRGYKDSMLEKFEKEKVVRILSGTNKIRAPYWFGVEHFHLSHRANLLRKDFNYYKDKFEDAYKIDLELPYIWPASEKELLVDADRI